MTDEGKSLTVVIHPHPALQATFSRRREKEWSQTMRYLPLSTEDRQTMLASIGVASIDDLFANVPAKALLKKRSEERRGGKEC